MSRTKEDTIDKWIRWILSISGRLKQKFDGSRIQNRSVSKCIIGNSNETIKMDTIKHLGNVLIIIAECMTL